LSGTFLNRIKPQQILGSSPNGNLCEPEPEPKIRFENRAALEIPDGDVNGISSSIEVHENIIIQALKVEIDLIHPYTGDLEIVLTHNGVSSVLWFMEGGSNNNIQMTFSPSEFDQMDATGIWSLDIKDHYTMDTGTLQSWALMIATDE